jgi:nucleoid-associated protein YgaU
MEKKQNDGLALVVGGLFILALVFATYNYFNRSNNSQDTLEKRIQEMQKEQESTTELTSEEKSEEAKGNINGEAATTSTIVTETTWIANDYNQGDISGDKYTVKSGDTLWEIAEAVYGNGADWVKLLDANSTSVGFLSNGQQALIMPGQVLNIAR